MDKSVTSLLKQGNTNKTDFSGPEKIGKKPLKNITPANRGLSLQKPYGSRGVQTGYTSPLIQPKLKIGTPGDIYEKEADRLSERVMMMPDLVCPTCVKQGTVQRQVDDDEEKKKIEEGQAIQPRYISDSITPFVQRDMDDDEEKKRIEEEGQLQGSIQPKYISDSIAPFVQRDMDDEEEKKRIEEGESIQPKYISDSITPFIQRDIDDDEEKKRIEEEGQLQGSLQPKYISGSIIPFIQRDMDDEEEKKELYDQGLQYKAGGKQTAQVSPGISSRINSLKGGGRPLSHSARAFFEPRFGADFSQVRVHTGSQAADTAKVVNAKAFTTGKDIVFGAGQYSPETETGRRLMGHELVHVIQQNQVDPSFSYYDIKLQLAPRTGHPHDRPSFEEQHVGFARYKAEKGWIYIDGPSGAGGHKLTAPGLDGIAYNTRTGQLDIVEQKGISKAKNIGLGNRPTAVTKNLLKNLNNMISKVEKMDLGPHKSKILSLLKETRDAVAGKGKVPSNVRIVITSAKATGITKGLKQYWTKRGINLPVEFRSTAPPKVSSSGKSGSGGAAKMRTGKIVTLPPASSVPIRSTPPSQINTRVLIAKNAVKNLSANFRTLRLTRIISAIKNVMGIAQILFTLDIFDIFSSGLSGEGFIHRIQIKWANKLEDNSSKTLNEYKKFSDSVGQLHNFAFLAAFDAESAGYASDYFWDIFMRLDEQFYDLKDEIDNVKRKIKEVDARINYAEYILNSKFMRIFTTAYDALIAGAYNDLTTISGSLSQAKNNLEQIYKLMKFDIEYCFSWYDYLSNICVKGGV